MSGNAQIRRFLSMAVGTGEKGAGIGWYLPDSSGFFQRF